MRAERQAFAGSAPPAGGRAGVLVVGALAVLAAGAWLLLLGEGDPEAAPAPVRGGGQIELTGDVAGPGTVEGDDGAGSLRSDAGSTSLGVRLPGPGRLTGTVLDRADGRGVGGVTVRLLPVPPVAADVAPLVAQTLGLGDEFGRRATPVATARAGPRGGFSFTGVREGRWYLDVVDDGVLVDVPASARVLASGSGGPVELWVRRGGQVRGIVLDAGGAPVAGADVALGSGAMSIIEAAGDGDATFRRTRTNEEGRFAFAAMPPGDGYELGVTGPGIAVTHVTGIAVPADGTPVELIVTGRRTARITGRVVARGADGELAPVAGARVGAFPRGLVNLKLAREILVQTHGVTGEDGVYVVDGVPPGAADLLAMADDCLPGRGPLVQVTGAGTFTAPDFELARGPVVRGRVVDAATGRPVQGARVLWNILDFDELEGQPSLAPTVVGAMAEFDYPRTDADGRFVAGPFPKEPPYVVRVLASGGYAPARLEWTPGAAVASTEEDALAAGREELLVELVRGASLTGRVVDGDTGEPVTAFQVELEGRIESDPEAPSALNPFAGALLFEDARGRFRIDGIVPGSAKLEVLADGYLTGALEVDLAPGERATDVVVELGRGGTIAGRVVDAEGQPVAGAQVTTDRLVKASFQRLETTRATIEDALAIKGQPRRRPPPVGFLRYAASLGLIKRGLATTDREGRFVLAGLESAEHEVLAFHREYRTAHARARAVAGEVVEVTLTAVEGGGLVGRLTDRFGQPVAGGTVIAASPGFLTGGGGSRAGLHQARSAEDGSYAILNMEAGPYVVIGTRGDENLAVASLIGSLDFGFTVVPADRPVRHDVVLEAAGGCRVTGRVLRGGVAVTDGILVATPEEGSDELFGLEFKASSIENDGSYAFEGLSPGPVRISFEERGRRRRGEIGQGAGGSVVIDVPDGPEHEVDIELPEGAVALRVIDRATGEPIKGARAVLSMGSDDAGPGNAGGPALFADPSRRRSRTTGADGRAAFADVGPGRYALEVVRARAGRGRARVHYGASEVIEFEVVGDREVDLGDVGLDPGATLRGHVRDAAGDGVKAVTVFAEPASGSAARVVTARTKRDGAFELEGLAPGLWRLTPRSSAYAEPAPTEVEVTGGVAPDEVTLVVQRGIAVTAEVIDAATGEPLPGIVAQLHPAGSEPPAASTGLLLRFFQGKGATDGDGLIDLGRHPTGADLTLTLDDTSGAGRPRKSVAVRTEDGDEQRVRVRYP